MKVLAVLLCSLPLCFIIFPRQSAGHEARPAYLEIIETESHHYRVVWKVPMRDGMRLRIQPAFPAHCRLASEPDVEGLPAALIERYDLECGPTGLDGETIEILGLQRTLVEVIVRIRMMDGREYKGTLRAAAPKYTIAPREPRSRIVGRFMLLGARHAVRKLPAVLLVFALTWAFGLKRRLAASLALFAVGYAAGFVGAGQGLIDISSEWGTISLAATAFMLASRSLQTADDGDGIRKWLFWLPLAGVIFGSAFGQDWAADGIAHADIPVSAVALLTGVWTGLLVLAGLAGLAGQVTYDLGLDRLVRMPVLLFYPLGTVSVFFFALALSDLITTGVVQPYLRPESVVFALAAGLLAAQAGGARSGTGLLLFVVMLATGLVAGARGAAFPLASVAIPLSLVVLGIALILRGRLPALIVLALASLACLYHGWLNGNWLSEHVSVTPPSAIGMCALFSGLLLFAVITASRVEPARIGGVCSAGGLLLLAAGFGMRFSGYEASEFGTMTVLASARLRLPLLSLLTIIASLYLGVRVGREGLAGGSLSGVRLPGFLIASSLLLVAALVAVPYGNIAIAHYSGSAGELTEEGAGRVIAGLLENTYRAVNQKGESEIYDRLAMSVDVDLVEDIYLESRRRTVLPSESGAEAKVIDVNIIGVTDGAPARDGRGYSFMCRWLVSGTVRHWAHKHNRLNRYAGRITIRPVDGAWKISALELIDEERL